MVERPTLRPEQLEVTTLGPCRHKSPLARSLHTGEGVGTFVPDAMRVLYEPRFHLGEEINRLSFQRAGAREKLFFDPAKTRAAIVTCGGLCPGINNVIRSLVLELTYNYGVANILGIRYGYRGLNPEEGRPPIELTLSRLLEFIIKAARCLARRAGRKTQRRPLISLSRRTFMFCFASAATARSVVRTRWRRRSLVASCRSRSSASPKRSTTISSFYSAVAEAEKVIDRAHVEAKGVLNGIGLVKLMGRQAGFITAAATLASGEANFALIPEVLFKLEGPRGFLPALERRLAAREHAVVVVAEGAGQDLLSDHPDDCDASGNRKLADIGLFLKQKIVEHFATTKMPAKVKYMDPSYHIRSVPANAADSLLCEQLARSAAHAGMAGKTDLLIGLWHNHLVHVPLEVSTGVKKQLSTEGELWTSVLALTGQERWL